MSNAPLQAGEEPGVLLISNGHGEDLMAAQIASLLRENLPGAGVMAMPLVGSGAAYTKRGFELVGPTQVLPSGGFLRNSLKNLWMDLRAGLFSLTLRQIAALRAAAPRARLVVCVGDVVLVLLAGLLARRPIVFLPTAKSDYIAPHEAFEVRLMRRFCTAVFPRDARTAEGLREHGVNAIFLGNAMMDGLATTGAGFGEALDPAAMGDPIDKGKAGALPSGGRAVTVGILPGSREEAYQNMRLIGEAAAAFAKLVEGRATFLVALAGGLNIERLGEEMAGSRWRACELPRVGSPREAGPPGLAGCLEREGIRLWIYRDRFGDILEAAEIVLGLAGTANEQAVGFGKPVVTFVGTGPQFNAKFAATQKRLLGEALSVVEAGPEAVAREMAAILGDPARYRRMQEAGRERMGGAGATGRIVSWLVGFLSPPSWPP